MILLKKLLLYWKRILEIVCLAIRMVKGVSPESWLKLGHDTRR